MDDGSIEILPVDPQMIYVPEYAPDTVIIRAAMVRRSSPLASAFRSAAGWMANSTGISTTWFVWTHDNPGRPTGGVNVLTNAPLD